MGEIRAAVERYGVARVGEQPGECPLVVGNAAGTVAVALFELRGDALARAARDDALLGEVLPEKEVEDQPHAGSQHEHNDPRQGLQRIPVVGDDDQNDPCDRDRIDDQKDVCENQLHLFNRYVSRVCPPLSAAVASAAVGLLR